jgi:hypothetical protein
MTFLIHLLTMTFSVPYHRFGPSSRGMQWQVTYGGSVGWHGGMVYQTAAYLDGLVASSSHPSLIAALLDDLLDGVKD